MGPELMLAVEMPPASWQSIVQRAGNPSSTRTLLSMNTLLQP